LESFPSFFFNCFAYCEQNRKKQKSTQAKEKRVLIREDHQGHSTNKNQECKNNIAFSSIFSYSVFISTQMSSAPRTSTETQRELPT